MSLELCLRVLSILSLHYRLLEFFYEKGDFNEVYDTPYHFLEVEKPSHGMFSSSRADCIH